MAAAAQGIRRYTGTFAGQLLLILLLFIPCRILCMDAFFHGFLHFFEGLNTRLFGQVNTPTLFAHEPYHSSSILFSSFLNPWFSIAIVLLYIPFVFRQKLVSARENYIWQERLLVGVIGFVQVWELCTYQYNFYLDNAFYLDRIVLLLLFLLLLRYRILLPLFIAFVFVYRSQFNYPVDGFPLLDIWLLYYLLIAYLAYMYAQLIVRDLKVPFVYIALCIVGATYFYSGMKKILISPHGYEWLLHNNPAYLFMNMHLLGWRANAAGASVDWLYRTLTAYKVPLQLVVLVIELAGLFFLKSRKLGIVLISLCVFMHLGIFAMGSTIFWKWLLVEATLILILVYEKKAPTTGLFTRRGFLLSLIAIVTSPVWLQPNMYGWHDTPMNQYFSFEVTDDKGNVYQMPKNEMNPYHQWFQYNTFHFLLKGQPCIWVTSFGFTGQYKLLQAIEKEGPGGHDKLIATYGRNMGDDVKTAKYHEFIKAYFANRNRRLGRSFFPFVLHTPYHLYNGVIGTAYHDQAPVSKFRTVYHLTYIKDGKVITLADKVIDEVDIPH